jgi:hypothetical protein
MLLVLNYCTSVSFFVVQLTFLFCSVYPGRLINVYSVDIFWGISGWILHTVCSLQYVKLGVGFFFLIQ